jgi:hypothetical protein
MHEEASSETKTNMWSKTKMAGVSNLQRNILVKGLSQNFEILHKMQLQSVKNYSSYVDERSDVLSHYQKIQ